MALTPATRIWNRAALENGGDSARDGDSALAALLLAHGMIMNGGVAHAIEALARDEVLVGAAGFRFFGLTAAAEVLDEAPQAGEARLELLNSRYGEAIPNDSTIAAAFESHLEIAPDAFSPVGSGST